MTERPILFSAPMVRAILEGRKVQTRRVVKPAPRWGMWPHQMGDDTWLCAMAGDRRKCPYGVAGDRLWVRETWWDIPEPSLRQLRDGADTWPKVAYDADESDTSRGWNREMGWRKRPSIFLPHKFSRITLEITDVRVQRVQEISIKDAQAEGAMLDDNGRHKIYGYALPVDDFWRMSPVDAYMHLWDKINAKRGFGWSVNPWVWALTFRRLV